MVLSKAHYLPISSVTFPDLSVYFVQTEMEKLDAKRAKNNVKRNPG